MESPKDEIIKKLQQISGEEVNLERPSPQFGDYSTNIALILSKKTAKPANEIAEELVQSFEKEKIKGISKIEAVGGFINFRLSDEFLQKQVEEIIKQGESFGSSSKNKEKKASVEFVSANPTGPLHIGNARGGPIGDVLSNVLLKTGYKVTREYLHNNVGGQVGKLGQAIYYELHPEEKPKEELAYQGSYIKELAQKVKSSKFLHAQAGKVKSPEEFGEVAVEILFDEIMEDCKAMGIKFDIIRKESDLRKKIPQTLGKISKFLQKKEGALWFAPSDEFLKDRETVVQKSDGGYTYFASDIVYHSEKFENGNNLVVDVLGSNHSGHVPRLQAAIKALGFDVSEFRTILYQFVRLKKGDLAVKMSKRQGDFVTAREVLDLVGKDAFRFFLLMQSPSNHMDFDLDLASKRANDNPVYYVQYAYSRIHGIFEKAGKTGNSNLSLLKEKEELELIRHLVKFPELVEEVSVNFSVHRLTGYCLDLANLFHKFYESHRVVSENKEVSASRLMLLSATQVVLKNSLGLLGIEAKERM